MAADPRSRSRVLLDGADRAATVELPVGALGLADGTGLADRLGVAGPARAEAGLVRVSVPPRSAAIYLSAS